MNYTVKTVEHFSQLVIDRVESSAEFVCQFENPGGTARKRFIVQIRRSFHPGVTAAIAVVLLVILSVVLAVVFFMIYRRRRVRNALRNS